MDLRRSLSPSPAKPDGQFLVFDQIALYDKAPPTGLPTRASSMCPPTARAKAAAGCISRCMAATRRARPSGDAFIKESGFARWADTNRLVILFPQVAGSVVNPHGCWDWWGYTDIDYLGKDAPQIAAIWAMAERLAAQP